jgi:hypothetical protein
MIQPIERFFRAFGARQKPYHRVTKVNSFPLKAGLALAGRLSERLGQRFFLYS